jgi:hypothetical protein
LDADGFSFQTSDAADAVIDEQFEAADHRAGQHRYPLAGIDRLHALRGIERPKVAFAARELPEVFEIRPIDIADIGKALGAQQVLGDVQRGYAEGRLQNANGRRFEDFSRSLRPWSADQTAAPAAAMPPRKPRRVWISAIVRLPLGSRLQLAFVPI